MRDTHTRQEGAHEELIAKVVPATLTGGFYAYVVTNGSHRYISGPHAEREIAERDAKEWIAGEMMARGRARRAQLERLKLHAGEHPAITDEQIASFVAGALPVAELDCPPTEDAPPAEWTGTAVRS